MVGQSGQLSNVSINLIFPPANFEEKTTFVAELKSLLPQADNSAIQVDGELAAISLHDAAAFSLQITGSKSSLSFNPVLFNKVAKIKAANSEVDEEDEQALLPMKPVILLPHSKKLSLSTPRI